MSYPLSFHNTFAPEREAVAQLVQLAFTNNDFLSKEEISTLTSIPTGKSSGKVVPHILYSEAMKLISVKREESKFKLQITALGETILNEDPYIVEELTQLICHVNLVSINSPALLWNYIFNHFLPNYGTSINKEVFSKGINKNFDSEMNLTPFRSSYINPTSFSALKLLTNNDDSYQFTPLKVLNDYKYVYAYHLLSLWEEILEKNTEITFEDIISKLKWGTAYLWSEREITSALEVLYDERIIVLNRQLSPMTIIKQCTSRELYSKLYSLLI
ncbi:DUF4007 family protein [Bacillus sp. AFS055030]|uniref:DUF4007 family protein n=1 Tax=Bacillus sp. AFS055030 TaxID=2033507 RepID=UPI000BFCC4B5|nr:DUF4007 family protein [Bacillus sp. AFS055030]PGL72615.1 hypothetical protein CN925_04475 [Bacillus sp. AFS055030]